MTTDKSTIVSSQYSFASTIKNGIHILQEPVPEIIELTAQVPLVKDFTLEYQLDDQLLMGDIYWTFTGTGNIDAGTLFVTHKDLFNGNEQTVQLANLQNVQSQGFRFQLGQVLHSGDQIEFVRTNSFVTQNTNNFVTIACKRCLLETVALRVTA